MTDLKPTESSLAFRKRASEIAHLSNAERDQKEQLKLIQQALSWISLAENEEFIACNAGESDPIVLRS